MKQLGYDMWQKFQESLGSLWPGEGDEGDGALRAGSTICDDLQYFLGLHQKFNDVLEDDICDDKEDDDETD